jgi:hypothetical protein
VAGLSYSVFSDSVGLAPGISWFPRKGDFVECAGDQSALKNRCRNWIAATAKVFHVEDERSAGICGMYVTVAVTAFRVAWGTLWLGRATR